MQPGWANRHGAAQSAAAGARPTAVPAAARTHGSAQKGSLEPLPHPPLRSHQEPHQTMPSTGDAVNVKVALRCRPLSKKELSEGDRSIFTKDGNVARLQDPDGRQNGGSPIEFGFDHVYDADSTQLQVYEDVGKPVVDAAFQGFNTTVFAYGQTGSGKSWSMTGGKDEQRGLIPRINAEIFERIENSSEEKLYLVQCSYFEIYNEIVGDSASVSDVF